MAVDKNDIVTYCVLLCIASWLPCRNFWPQLGYSHWYFLCMVSVEIGWRTCSNSPFTGVDVSVTRQICSARDEHTTYSTKFRVTPEIILVDNISADDRAISLSWSLAHLLSRGFLLYETYFGHIGCLKFDGRIYYWRMEYETMACNVE